MINRMSRFLILFLLLAAVYSFLTTSHLTVGHKVEVSVAHAASPQGFIEIFTWKGSSMQIFSLP